MQELIDLALDTAQRGGAGYADIRLVEQATESLTVKNGTLAEASSNRSAGFGVRVLIDGAWGFAASSRLERDEVERTTREAVAIARASGLATREPILLDDSPPAVADYRTPFREDPFAVPLDEKLRLLFDADQRMAKVAGVTLRTSSIEAGRERKTFASTEGARIEQELVDVFGFRGPIRIIAAPGEIPPEFYSATTIIGATNVPDVLDIGRVNPGTLIVDDSWPHCFNARSVIARFAQRGDVLFTEGGVLQAPKAISTLRYLPRALERSLPAPYRAAVTWHQPHEITGCILSSLLTARFAQISPTLGYVDAATCQQHFVVLDELGFQGARLHCDYYVLPEPIIAAFRQRFGT